MRDNPIFEGIFDRIVTDPCFDYLPLNMVASGVVTHPLDDGSVNGISVAELVGDLPRMECKLRKKVAKQPPPKVAEDRQLKASLVDEEPNEFEAFPSDTPSDFPKDESPIRRGKLFDSKRNLDDSDSDSDDSDGDSGSYSDSDGSTSESSEIDTDEEYKSGRKKGRLFRTPRVRKKRPATTTRKGSGPSSKMSSRIFAFHTLFSCTLPDTIPEFMSDEDEWNDLVEAAATGKLVTISDFRDGQVTVRFPIALDIIIHSLANYGPLLKAYTSSPSTRFRWWTDSAIPQLRVLNRKANHSIVERMIQLPESMVSHPYLQYLFHHDQMRKLCLEFTTFFDELLKLFMHPDDYFKFSQGAFGRSRKRPRITTDGDAAVSSVVNALIEQWDEKNEGKLADSEATE